MHLGLPNLLHMPEVQVKLVNLQYYGCRQVHTFRHQ